VGKQARPFMPHPHSNCLLLPSLSLSRTHKHTLAFSLLLSSPLLANQIVEMLNAVYCLAELLEFAAFIWLRIKAPQLPRPYRVPFGTVGCILMLLPATVLLVSACAVCVLASDRKGSSQT
jgi:amino acid transporter